MHRNPYWLALLAFLTLCVFGYTLYTSIKLYQYNRLSQQVAIQYIQWSVKALKEDQIFPQAHYQFIIRGQSYQGHTVFEEAYLNQWAAQEAIKKLSSQTWKAWIDPYQPSNSTLQKIFPFKQCLSTIVLWLLLIYFFILGRYVIS